MNEPNADQVLEEFRDKFIGSKDASEAVFGRLLATDIVKIIDKWYQSERDKGQYGGTLGALMKVFVMILAGPIGDCKPGRERELMDILIDKFSELARSLADSRVTFIENKLEEVVRRAHENRGL